MADITTVIADILKAQDDAYATPEAIAANVGPSPSQQIATLQGELTTANATIATLNAKIATALADAQKVVADLQ